MNNAKKVMAGLLVLMLLAGLMVMPVGAEVVPSVTNGSFENVSEGRIEGWTNGSDSKLTASVVKSGDDGYEASPDGGNYVKIERISGQSGNSVELYTDILNLQSETTYELSMYVNIKNNHPHTAWLRVDYYAENGSWLTDKKATYNPNIRFERNYGNRYYNMEINEGNSGWAIVKFNFTLPEGAGGIRLNLGLNAGSLAYYDGISIKKATNLINWSEFNGRYNPEAGKHAGLRFNSSWDNDGTYCGYEYWFSTTNSGAIQAPAGGFWDGMGTINEEATKKEATLEQYVPVRNGQLYKLKFDGKGYGAARTLTLNLTFAEDSEYNFTPLVFDLVKDRMKTYETYILVNGNFKYNDIPQSLTEARFIFSATGESRIDNISLTEVDPISLSATINGAEGKELANGTNTVSVTGKIVKEAWGGADTAKLFVCVYEGNRLTNVKLVSLDCDANGSATATTEPVSVTKGEGVNLKAFLWDMENGMQPLDIMTVQ